MYVHMITVNWNRKNISVAIIGTVAVIVVGMGLAAVTGINSWIGIVAVATVVGVTAGIRAA